MFFLTSQKAAVLSGLVSFALWAAPVSAQTPFQKLPERPADVEKEKNLYLIGYAHLDTQWRWSYADTIRENIVNTMRRNFPLFEAYPHYIFNFTGARRYEFMKEYYPEDYAKVKQYVAVGRWQPAGSSMDENDVNVPSLESAVRNYLYGNRFFDREFGRHGEDCLLPDSFGFPASLPEILAHGGIKGFSTCKLQGFRPAGVPFNIGKWIGPDGSSVIAALDPGKYTSDVDEDLSASAERLKRINETGEKSGAFVDYRYFGVGDTGGAPKASTVEGVERSLAGKGPVRVISARSDQMFKDIPPETAAKLPTYQGELMLREHSSGSITSQAYMKRWNRKNEQLANAAESAAVTASWLGAFPYPYDHLYQSWDLLLGSQMHDTLPGTALPKAYDFAWNDEVLAANGFSAVTERSVAAVLSAMDTRAKGVPVAVYNALPIEREDAVEAAIPAADSAEFTAYDPQGRPVPTQVLERANGTARVLFLARVPSVGYAVYDLRPGAAQKTPSGLAVSADSLENSHYRVRIDGAGDLVSVFDKTLNRELLSAPARLSFHTECPTMWPSWNMDWADRKKPARGYVDGPAKIRIAESGPARVALEIERKAENSIFKQQIRLAAGGDSVEIANQIDWRSVGGCLKAGFPLAASNATASYDDKVGVVSRVTNSDQQYEMPLQQWMDLTDASGSFGVAILNDSKYGSDKPDDRTLRLTLLYTPGVRNVFHDQATQDLGRHEMVYAIAGHTGDWAEGKIPWRAGRLNQPLRSFLPQAHAGTLGRIFSLVGLNSDQVQIVAVKKAEDSDEIVVRLKELTGKPAPEVALRFAAVIASAREIDGQERPVGPASVKGGALACPMKPFGLRAFALKVAPARSSAVAVASQPVPLPYDLHATTSNDRRQEGAMTEKKESYPAELFPKTLTREGVEFQFGSTEPSARNALAAAGQEIALPKGEFNRVHLVAAAVEDAEGQIKIGGASQPFNVPAWTGYVGQWDRRLWNPDFPDIFTVGLDPGFTKRAPVAWFATHHHTANSDTYYEFSYLFQLSYDLPKGAQSIVLPDNRKIRVFAVSVSREPSAAPAAAPLFDTLAGHRAGGEPSIPQAGRSFDGPAKIELLPPLYYHDGELHYTLDGSEPTKDSAVYTEPFEANDNVEVAARAIPANGEAGPVVRGKIQIDDRTAPKIGNLFVKEDGKLVEVRFSKAMNRESASAAGNYSITPAVPLDHVTLSQDGRTASLALGQPLKTGVQYALSLKGVKDAIRNANLADETAVPFNDENIVYRFEKGDFPAAKCKAAAVPRLPIKAHEAWSMNLFVKPRTLPKSDQEKIVIGGFGKTAETDITGSCRYLVIFSDGLRLMITRRDVVTNTPLDAGAWQMLTVTYDGRQVAMYKNGEPIKKQEIALSAVEEPDVTLGTPFSWSEKYVFDGEIREFTIRQGILSDAEVKNLHARLQPSIQP